MKRILTVTLNAALDKNVSVDHLVPERKLRCSAPRLDPGGGGINVARVVRELGGEATALWLRGGVTGLLVEELLDEKGLPHLPLPIDGTVRENLYVDERETGQRFRIVLPGPEVSGSELDRLLESLGAFDPVPDFLVLSGSVPPGVDTDVYSRLASAVPESCRVVVDTSGDALCRALEGPVDYIKPNLREMAEIAGREVKGDEDIETVSRRLLRRTTLRAVVCSLGRAGALLVTREGAMRVRSPTVPIRSSVGSGDSTIAGLVYSLAGGASLEDAVRFGVAAGAAAVTTPGTSLCLRCDVERLYEEMIRETQSDHPPR